MRRPLVLQLLHSDDKGGVEALARMIGDGLAATGARVETRFLYPSASAGKAAKAMGIARAMALLARRPPDMILAYQPTASVITGAVGRALGIRLRVAHQTAIPSVAHPLSRALDRFLGSRSFYSANVVNSHATSDAFKDYPEAYRRGLVLIEHGLEPPKPRRGRAEVRTALGVGDEAPVLLCAGRLCEQKAQDRIIRTLPLAPGAKLWLAGGGPLEGEFRTLAKSLGVEDRVRFLGALEREQVGDYIAAADVFAFPSVWETFGLAPVEAAMLGAPVACSDIPVLREVLTVEGKSPAQFADATDPAAFAAAIQRALTPGAIREAATFADILRRRHAPEAMLARYRAMLWPDAST